MDNAILAYISSMAEAAMAPAAAYAILCDIGHKPEAAGPLVVAKPEADNAMLAGHLPGAGLAEQYPVASGTADKFCVKEAEIAGRSESAMCRVNCPEHHF